MINNKLAIEDKLIGQFNRTEYQNSIEDVYMYICFIFMAVYTNADAVLNADERACRFTTVIAIDHNHDFVVGPMTPYYYYYYLI